MRARALAGVLLFLLGNTGVAAGQRKIAIIIDTSGSMLNSDKPRYTVQIAKILADLVSDNDRQTVTRLPLWELSCSTDLAPKLQIALQPPNRSAFKAELEGLIKYSGDNHFAATVRTAIASLGYDASGPRLLLFLADSGGLGSCDAPLTQELIRLHESGAMVAAINIGNSAGAFATNPAFDFTTPALDSEQLMRSVAQVYQRFLGGSNVQTGGATTEVSVEIGNFVKEAFLVVASDGPINAVHPDGSNPGAANIETNYRGGGETRGLDNTVRGYRIVRITRPAAGRWVFKIDGSGRRSGWMLLQDYSIALTLISGRSVAAGVRSRVEAALTDELTGQRITDLSSLSNVKLELYFDGRTVRLTDDGSNGDRKQGDGVYTGGVLLDRPGKKTVRVRLRAGPVDRSSTLEFDGVAVRWRLAPQVPSRLDASISALLKVKIESVGAVTESPPDSIQVRLSSGGALTLRDNGQNGDQNASDRIYSAEWTPPNSGTESMQFTAVGTNALPAETSVEVLGYVEFGKALPVRIGPIKSDSTGETNLDLSTTRVAGSAEVRISTGLNLTGATLEFGSDRWQALSPGAISLNLSSEGPRVFKVRLQTGGCPAAFRFDERHEISLSTTRADGTIASLLVPLAVEVIPDPWYICWAIEIGLGIFCVAGAILGYGYWSPSRFGPRIGIQLSPEEDLTEGAFYALRAQRGARSGFFRDAHVYINEDFLVSGLCRNALVKVRAEGKQLRLRCHPGRTVWRRNLDGTWEIVDSTEAPVRTGVVYRNDAKTLFFEFRNQ